MEFLTGVFGYVLTHKTELVQAALALIGFFSIVANFTPTESDNKAVAFVGVWVNRFAGYWNDPDKPSTPPSA